MSVTGAAAGVIETTGAALIDPLWNLWNTLVSALPGIVIALILIIFGYVLSSLIGHGIKLVLQKAGLDKKVQKAKLSKAIGTNHVSGIIGELIKWFIFIVFLTAAAEQLKLGVLSDLLMKFALWLPNVLIAVILMLVVLFVANTIQIKIVEHSKMRGMRVFAGLLKIVLIVIGVVIALEQLGFKIDLFSNVILIIVGSLGAGIALALGIGLGLGLKKEAESIISDIKKNL